ncbi:MAG: hypothetical protein R2822_05930 [Spirosomataceae bacterium]
MKSFQVVSPIDGSVYLERDYVNAAQIEHILDKLRSLRKYGKQFL